MNRFVDVGFDVAACSALPTVPAVTGTWYQRTAAWLEELPCTVWLSHSDSTPPMFVYWFCAIRRGCSVSMTLPFLDGTSSGAAAHELPVIESVGPVNVELAVFVQSTWNFHTLTRSVWLQTDVKRSGLPAGGVPVWARALLGSIEKTRLLLTLEGASNETTWAVAPASIRARFSAHTRTLMKPPFARNPNMFADMYRPS